MILGYFSISCARVSLVLRHGLLHMHADFVVAQNFKYCVIMFNVVLIWTASGVSYFLVVGAERL